MTRNVCFEHKIHNPPKYPKADKVIKKQGVKITLQQMERILGFISWEIEHRGCKHYLMINHKGVRTDIWLYQRSDYLELEIKIRDKKDNAWGGNYGGVSANLDECAIHLYCGWIWFFSGDKKKGGMDFRIRNGDKKYSKSEEYLASLPRHYQKIMRCSRCGTRMNETHKLPGLYFVLDSLSGLSALFKLFNAPRCPKCEYKSYSDINFAIKTEVYRVSTNRPVNQKSLEKLYSKEHEHYRELVRTEEGNGRK